MAKSTMKDHPLGIAARYNDAETEEKSLQEFVESQGLTINDVRYLAEQRAMRVALLRSGRHRWRQFQEAYATGKPRAFHLTSVEKALVSALLPAYFDGILIGWRGRQIADRQG